MAMETQSENNKRLSTMIHLKNQIDQAAGNLGTFLGRRDTPLNLTLRYNIDALKSSDEFINTSQTIAQQTRILQFYFGSY